MGDYRLAIDVGATKIAYGIFDEESKIIFRHRTSTPIDIMPDELTAKFYNEIDDVLERSQISLSNLRGISVGMPSYVDYDHGFVVTSGGIHNIKNYPARDVLEKKYPNTRIVIDGDTNMAALAEHKFGAGRGFPHMVYCALSTGLGSGFIVNNQVFRGSYGGAGETGHMLITPGEGLECGCGNRGCFMSYACGSFIAKHAQLAIQNGEQSMMSSMVSDISEITSIHLAEAYRAGDALAGRLMDQLIYYIALHIYNLFIAFNINCYVCGGGLLNMGDFFLERIRTQVDTFNKQENQKIYIKAAELGGDNGIIGCAVALEDEK
ncbi:MAG: ROK family protein [Hespellia sp.]|nr:ROK family protein [Hespellia sp.]